MDPTTPSVEDIMHDGAAFVRLIRNAARQCAAIAAAPPSAGALTRIPADERRAFLASLRASGPQMTQLAEAADAVVAALADRAVSEHLASLIGAVMELAHEQEGR